MKLLFKPLFLFSRGDNGVSTGSTYSGYGGDQYTPHDGYMNGHSDGNFKLIISGVYRMQNAHVGGGMSAWGKYKNKGVGKNKRGNGSLKAMLLNVLGGKKSTTFIWIISYLAHPSLKCTFIKIISDLSLLYRYYFKIMN